MKGVILPPRHFSFSQTCHRGDLFLHEQQVYKKKKEELRRQQKLPESKFTQRSPILCSVHPDFPPPQTSIARIYHLQFMKEPHQQSLILLLPLSLPLSIIITSYWFQFCLEVTSAGPFHRFLAQLRPHQRKVASAQCAPPLPPCTQRQRSTQSSSSGLQTPAWTPVGRTERSALA